jgi:hypothetical protein
MGEAGVLGDVDGGAVGWRQMQTNAMEGGVSALVSGYCNCYYQIKIHLSQHLGKRLAGIEM